MIAYYIRMECLESLGFPSDFEQGGWDGRGRGSPPIHNLDSVRGIDDHVEREIFNMGFEAEQCRTG